MKNTTKATRYTKPSWNLFRHDTALAADARARIKRAYRRWARENNQPQGGYPLDLEKWARARPQLFKRSLVILENRSVSLYENMTEENQHENTAERNKCISRLENFLTLWKVCVTWPGLYPHCQELGTVRVANLIQELTPRIVHLEGLKWWRKNAGHHVCSAAGYINGRQVVTVQDTSRSELMAWEALVTEGWIERTGEREYSSETAERQGFVLQRSIDTVSRKKDLHS